MLASRPRARFVLFLPFLILGLITSTLAATAESAEAPPAGQRIVTAGHSFHMFLPEMLREMAQSAGIKGHTQVAAQSIGGSRVIQHWDVADEKNKVKPALRSGEVDVLTLSPIYLPDQGIENFVRLAAEHSDDVRVTLQLFWLPYDVYDVNYQKKRPAPVDRNTRTVADLHKENAAYFASFEEHAKDLNKQLGRPVVFLVPVGQAVIALRAKIIAGEAPGLQSQEDLFTDAIGHASPPLKALTAYCHYAVIYRRSPVGLPVPAVLKKPNADDDMTETTAALNRLLQELAWQAALAHPLSGVEEVKTNVEPSRP